MSAWLSRHFACERELEDVTQPGDTWQQMDYTGRYRWSKCIRGRYVPVTPWLYSPSLVGERAGRDFVCTVQAAIRGDG